MTLVKTADDELTRARRAEGAIGPNDVAYNYASSDGQPTGFLLTGAVAGTVVLDDGTAYDVTPEVIEHELGKGHGEAIAYHIHRMHQSAGRIPADQDTQFRDETGGAVPAAG